MDPDLIRKPKSNALATFAECGEQLGGVSAKTIERLVNSGQLASVRIGGKRFIHIDEVARAVAFGVGGRNKAANGGVGSPRKRQAAKPDKKVTESA